MKSSAAHHYKGICVHSVSDYDHNMSATMFCLIALSVQGDAKGKESDELSWHTLQCTFGIGVTKTKLSSAKD